MVDVSSDGHLQTTCQCLEDTLNLVVFVLAFCFDVEVHLSRIGERLEEM